MKKTETFAHLHVHSAFSFGDGASSVESLVLRAARYGLPALALTDTMSLSGVPSIVRRCEKAGIVPIGGSEIILEGGDRLTLLADGPTGFSALSRIVSLAHLRDVKRIGPRVRWEDLEENAEALICLTGAGDDGLLPRLLCRNQTDTVHRVLDRLMDIFGRENVLVEVTRTFAEGEHALSRRLLELADSRGLSPVATNHVRHATKMDFAAHEALRRVALRLSLDEEHGDLPLNGERYLKSSDAMHRLFADRPDAVDNVVRLAERLAPPLDAEARHFPRYPHLPPGESAFSYLSGLAWHGAKERYGSDRKGEATDRLVHELEVLRDLNYADYFLICKDICDEARRRQIGFALRGSAVGCAVAFCLGMSSHDPVARRISFERFLSKARKKPPDIDVDFRHDLRDSIMEYTRKTYGEDRVAGVANYVTYKGRSLLRDMGKVLSVDGGEVDRLRELLWHSRGDDLAQSLEKQPELRALGIDASQYADLFALCATLAGLPRHLGTHSSGLVVSDVPIASVCPVLWAAKGVTIAALDKDDVESPGIGLLKMDQLCLRALTAIDIAVGHVRESESGFDYDARDRDDADTLALIRAAETVGVFQLESPAQMALQWRLQADKFDDLVASVALIRPGPLVGGSVEPYVWRRKGWQKVTYPIPELEPVLRDTYGRILFQDQVLDVIAVVGNYTLSEADVWLKTMTHARSEETMTALGLELLERAKPKGLRGKAFEKLWKQIKGFARYGFCEGHAVAFASHAQGTAYLLRHYPAEFLAAVLSVEPCGFWPVATVVSEAIRRGVQVSPPCLNRSDAREWNVENDGTSATGKAIRVSLSFVQGVTEEMALSVITEREDGGPFASLAEVGRRLWFVPRDVLEWLTLAGALDAFSPSRRRTLWSLPAVHRPPAKKAASNTAQESLPLPVAPYVPEKVPDFDASERFEREWKALGFSPSTGHPMRMYREAVQASGALACAALQARKAGEVVMVAGLCLRPHRPPTPSGQVFVFFTLEDETGLAQVTVTPDVYERVGTDLFGNAFLAVTGRVEARGAGKLLKALSLRSIWLNVQQ